MAIKMYEKKTDKSPLYETKVQRIVRYAREHPGANEGLCSYVMARCSSKEIDAVLEQAAIEGLLTEPLFRRIASEFV
jgi:hypothetical protein